MGERQNGPFQLSFNALLKVDFQGSRVTSDLRIAVFGNFFSGSRGMWPGLPTGRVKG